MDRAEALALAMHRESLCPLCGRPVDVCTSDEETGGPTFGVRQSTCRATLAILEQQRAQTDGGKKEPHPYARAFLWAAIARE